MADRIKVRSEWLDSCASDLNAIENVIRSAQDTLSGINLTSSEGGDLNVRLNLGLALTGGRFTGGNVREDIQALSRAAQVLGARVSQLSTGACRAAQVFEQVESDAVRLMERNYTNGTSQAYEEKGNVENSIREAQIRKIISQLENDDAILWPGYIDWSWLSWAAGVGHVFTFLGAKETQLSDSSMAWALLDGLMGYEGTKRGMVNDMENTYGNWQKGLGASKKITDTIKNVLTMAKGDEEIVKKASETFEKGMKDWTVGSVDSSSMGEVLGWLGALKEGTEAAKKASAAFNHWQGLINLDDQTVSRMQAGLMQSGDPAAKRAAELLALSRDPVACFGSCMVSFAGDAMESTTVQACKMLVNSTGVGKAVDMGVSMGTGIADLTMGSSDTALAAQKVMRYNEMRKNSASAVKNMIDAYNSNPCEATYTQVKSAYNAYNVISGEMANSYKAAVDSTTDSLAGRVVYSNFDKTYINDIGIQFYGRNAHI